MAHAGPKHNLDCWSDRFNRPSASTLTGGLEPGSAAVLDRLRAGLGDLGLNERLGWHGIAWGWSWAYRLNAKDDPARAYLAPRAGAVLLIIPISFDRVDLSALPGGIRQTIGEAKTVDRTAWCEWALTDPKSIDALLALIDLEKV